MMYRIRLGCGTYARMNILTDQARRMMYIGETIKQQLYSDLLEKPGDFHE